MKRKRYSFEQSMAPITQHEMGISVSNLIRKLGIAEATSYCWKK